MIKKAISALFISISLSTIGHAKIEAVIGSLPLESNQNLFNKIPTTSESEIIISRPQYVLSYNKINRAPNYVIWKLDNQSFGKVSRTNNFQQDPDLQQYLRNNDPKYIPVSPEEYKGSCFDRGHQAPSADRTASVDDNNATFMMSNMAPQTPYLNRVIWEHLESYTRNVIRTQNKIAYIITGPIYDEDFGKIGPNQDILVPSKEFKIIFFLNPDQTPSDINANTQSISVIMPNRLKDGSKPVFTGGGCKMVGDQTLPTSPDALAAPVNDWEQYKSSVNQIESEAKLNILDQVKN